MELKQIEAFLMVVEKESFSAAAEALFTAQPTISLRIQHLEQSLNAKLFAREKGKKISLTPTGEKIYPYFKQAYQLLKQGVKVAQDSTKKQKAIVLSCTNYMGVEIVPELLKELYGKFPEINFIVKVVVSDDIAENIRDGEIDAGFSYAEYEMPYDDITTIRIAQQKNILVCAPDYPLSRLDSLSASDLKDERIILYNKAFRTAKIVDEYMQNEGVFHYQAVEISNLEWIKMMLRKGIGVAFIQKIIVTDELKNGKLIELPLKHSLPPTSIYLTYKKSLPEEIKNTIIETTRFLFQRTQNE